MKTEELQKAKRVLKALHVLFYNIRNEDLEHVKEYMGGHFWHKLQGRLNMKAGSIKVLDVGILHAWFHADLNEELKDYFIERAIERY